MALLTCLGLCLRQRACLHVLVFTVAERFSAEARDGKPREEALCSLLLVSWWLRTHWPMKVTWPSQDQKGGPMNTISWREKQQTIVPTFSLPGSLFSTDLCEAECCFLVAQGWSSRGWLYSRAWKRRIPTLRHPALMRMAHNHKAGTKNPQMHFPRKQSILVPIISTPLKFSIWGENSFYAQSFHVSTF